MEMRCSLFKGCVLKQAENKMPWGILLLNGDADTEMIEQIEDYITDIRTSRLPL
jgi:hypothetical protein